MPSLAAEQIQGKRPPAWCTDAAGEDSFKGGRRDCRKIDDALAFRALPRLVRRVSVLLALCTAPNDEAAEQLARTLVEERLAACVNRLGVHSTWRWQGAIHAEPEVLLLIKTTHERFDALKSRLPALHPYDVPELIAFDALDGLAGYLGWVEAETAPHGRPE